MRCAVLAFLFFFSTFSAGGLVNEGYAAGFPENRAGARTGSVCVDCHMSDLIRPEYRDIPQQWQGSWHYQNGVSCHDCHGGDPDDVAMSMSAERGFIGKPDYADVPQFCGKCHIGIMESYLMSGHGMALKETGSGPNCITCHGVHGIQKASIDIISEERCTQCHSYDRAGEMKQALFLTEKRIRQLDEDLNALSRRGVYADRMEKTLFGIHAEFRTLFHTVDVDLVKKRTDEFAEKLHGLDLQVKTTYGELAFRKKFSFFLMVLFASMALLIFLLSKKYEK